MPLLKFVSLLLLFYVSVISCSKEDEPEVEEHFFDEDDYAGSEDIPRWLSYLSSSHCSGRRSGTVGNENARWYLQEELESMGYSPRIESFCKKGIMFSNIIVDIDLGKDYTIIVGAHYDGQLDSPDHPAANDNASGVVALMSIASKMSVVNNDMLSHNFQFVFFDGEERINDDVFNGSRYHVEHLNVLPLFYLNIDNIGNYEMRHRVVSSSEILLSKLIDISKDYSSLELVFSNSIIKQNQDFVPFREAGINILTWRSPLDSNQTEYNHTIYDRIGLISLSKIDMIASMSYRLIIADYNDSTIIL